MIRVKGSRFLWGNFLQTLFETLEVLQVLAHFFKLGGTQVLKEAGFSCLFLNFPDHGSVVRVVLLRLPGPLWTVGA